MRQLSNRLFIALSTLLVASQGVAADQWTLEEALEQVLGENPDARIAEYRIRSSQSRLQQAQATWWPQLKFQSGYLYTDNPVSVFGSTLNQRSFNSSLDFNDVPATDNLNLRGLLTVPVYSGGRNSAARNAARAEYSASKMDAQSVRLALSFAVTHAFLTVVRAGQFVETAEATVESFESNLNIAKTRFEAGTILKPEVLDLEVRLAESTEDLSRARNAKELAGLALGSLLGMENEVVQVANTPVLIESPDKEHVNDRPELASAELREQSAEAEIKGARSGYLPSLNGFGAIDYNYGWRNNNGGASYTVGLLLNWDLWDGKLTKGKVGEAGARLDEIQEYKRKLRLDLSFEVHQARVALKEAVERIGVAQKTVGLAEESVELTRARFEEGLVLASQLIDAETAATRARVRLITGLTDRQIAAAALRKAVGMLPLSQNEIASTQKRHE